MINFIGNQLNFARQVSAQGKHEIAAAATKYTSNKEDSSRQRV